MRKRRLKKSVIRNGIVFLGFIFIIIGVVIFIKVSNYHKTNLYKLKQIGYSSDEINRILDEPIDNISYVLDNGYSENINKILNEKYYLSKNFLRYINYMNSNGGVDLKNVISLVNTNRDKEEYTDVMPADVDRKELVLVNKYYYLDKDYKPNDVSLISSWYAYADNYSSDVVMEEYKKMFNDASKAGLDLIISSGFRDYKNQEETYNEYVRDYGEEYAKRYASLPGYSEHQTGLAFDILTTGVLTDDFEKTDEFKWLKDNCYKYGFILRYPKGKENITGYDYESWHYRYVGLDVARKIRDEGITFDEYYAYYIER